MMLSPRDIARFHRKTARNQNGCLEFTGPAFGPSSPYGTFRVKDRNYKAHRIGYTIACGPIPDGKVIRHRCRNRKCVEQTHLMIGSPAENIADKYDDMALRKREKPTPRGIAEVLLFSDAGKSQREIAYEMSLDAGDVTYWLSLGRQEREWSVAVFVLARLFQLRDWSPKGRLTVANVYNYLTPP